jgi:hypothetical protein
VWARVCWPCTPLGALPGEVIDQIADRTDGVPLFIEELTKSVLESGVPAVGIPTTLHDSLMTRFDRLSSVRRVAQIGAAIGRQFPYTLLRAISRLPEDELQAALARLVASELVFQRGIPPDAVYSFKHALVQDAAHSSLLRATRQQLHAEIAEALEAQSPELMDTQPELFAQHYDEGRLVEKSVAYWGKAGRRSAARSAMAEAAAQFQRALGQLALLPDSPERQRQELDLQTSLGSVRLAISGYAASRTGQSYGRARELWEQLGYPSGFLSVPWGQWMFHVNRGELDIAQPLAEDLLRLGEQRDDVPWIVMGKLSLGIMSMFRGEFTEARSDLEAVLRLYAPSQHEIFVREAGVDPHLNARMFLSIVLLCLGYPDQASALSKDTIDEAKSSKHRPSLATSLAVRTRLLALMRDNV